MIRDEIISVFHQVGQPLTDTELSAYESHWKLKSTRWGSNLVSFQLSERLKKLKKCRDGSFRLPSPKEKQNQDEDEE